jgi:signal recognition particle receptor subunit beta
MTRKSDLATKYAPKKIKEIIGSSRQIKDIEKWLVNFRINARKNLEKFKEKKTLRKNKKKEIIISDDNEEDENITSHEINIYNSHSNNKSEDCSCMIVLGDNGTGKTTIIRTILETKNYYIKMVNFSDIITDKPENYVDTLFSYDDISDDNTIQTRNKVIVIDDIQNACSQFDKRILSSLIEHNHLYWVCPVIFIGSNKHKKIITTLKKECYNINIYQPSTENMCVLLETICLGEKIKFEDETVPKRIIEYCENDYKKLIILLEELYRIYKRTPIKLNELNKHIELMGVKDIERTLYENTMELITNYKNIDTTIKIFETEKSTLPLMIQQNHLNIISRYSTNKKNIIKTALQITENLSYGDVIENYVYSEQNWNLQHTCGFYYCVYPSYIFNENVNKKQVKYNKFKLNYPKDFNKTSTRCINYKNIKIINDYFNNMSIYDYITLIHIIKELLVQDRITECKSLLQKYNLSDVILTYVIKIDKIIDTIPFDIIEKKLKYISNENMIIKEKKRKNKKLL